LHRLNLVNHLAKSVQPALIRSLKQVQPAATGPITTTTTAAATTTTTTTTTTATAAAVAAAVAPAPPAAALATTAAAAGISAAVAADDNMSSSQSVAAYHDEDQGAAAAAAPVNRETSHPPGVADASTSASHEVLLNKTVAKLLYLSFKLLSFNSNKQCVFN